MNSIQCTLSKGCADCLKVICDLQKIGSCAHASDIAVKMAISPASVSKILKLLAEDQLIFYTPHYPVKLTMRGKIVAGELVKKRTGIEFFLNRILGVSPERASELSHKIEHIIDDDTAVRIGILSESLLNRNDCRNLRSLLAQKLSEVQKSSPER
ncbi:MAG: metal-dependent transcriptional regulator [Lentisphaeria bacterium]|nr:metal-dependent transcriptional regulator [Lentisphaeria bacterium]